MNIGWNLASFNGQSDQNERGNTTIYGRIYCCFRQFVNLLF
jgi:hypothetical protein